MKCQYCGAPFTSGCECHSGNKRKPGYENPSAFNHVSEEPVTKKELLNQKIDNFRAFVMDYIDDGMGGDISVNQLLRDSMEVFMDLEEDFEAAQEERAKSLKLDKCNFCHRMTLK